jgi:tetratricopeptide (TPR) repeat protein
MLLLTIAEGCAQISSPLAPDVAVPRVERAEEAVRAFEAERDRAQFQAAMSSWHQADAGGCRESLEALLARNPRHREGCLLYAELSLAESKPGDAVDMVKALIEDNPGDAEAFSTLGMLLEATGRTEEAGACFDEAQSLHGERHAAPPSHVRQASGPSNPSDDGGLGYAVRPATYEMPSQPSPQSAAPKVEHAIAEAVAALRRDQTALAVEGLLAALADAPQSAELHQALGAAYYQQGEYRAAQVALQQALSLDNASPLSYFLMGSTLERLGQSGPARRHFDEARRLDPRFAKRAP